MALREGDLANFRTLLRAAKNGDLALVESRRKSNGEYVALIAAVSQEGEEFIVGPLGEMVAGNPYELYEDPSRFGGPKEWSPRKPKA
jgi:hypothetical protein